ncbi:hypothetical protein ACFFLM_23465 [Deinococcus oregonensis]|uniref:Uncharacterized protein n=1 Tax=Deinococcus oregonensis TaxID=1805970 RepID=A0ABV6B942_9DEIO
MSGPRLDLDPFTSPRLALLLVADEVPQTALKLQDACRAHGFAQSPHGPHLALDRLARAGMLRTSVPGCYTLTPQGQAYREACGAGLPTALVRLLSCLSIRPQPGDALSCHAAVQGWGGRAQTSTALATLCLEELAQRERCGVRTWYALTPLGLFTQADLGPAFIYLGLTVAPVHSGPGLEELRSVKPSTINRSDQPSETTP